MRTQLSTPSPADLAYAAGFIDGEGTIRVSKTRRLRPGRSYEYFLQLSAGNRDPRPLEKLQRLFGGYFSHRHETRPNRAPHFYQWSCLCRQAASAIESLQGFLVVKSEHAQLALEFQARCASQRLTGQARNRPLSPEEIALREDYYWRSRTLNLKGRDTRLSLLPPPKVHVNGPIQAPLNL